MICASLEVKDNMPDLFNVRLSRQDVFGYLIKSLLWREVYSMRIIPRIASAVINVKPLRG